MDLNKPFITIGMAAYNNRHEVWFTIQALRMYHDLSDVEILVVDNYGDDKMQAFLEGPARCRYVRYTKKQSTSAPRDLVFSEAKGQWVFCIDPHIFLAAGAITKLKSWLRDNPDCMDLLQAPYLNDDMVSYYDSLKDEWGNDMWGVWNPAGITTESEPYPIMMQGLGLFGCRKDAWLGFNSEFTGFGGEEGYIHAKFRKAGRQTICLPFLSWVHKFKDGDGDVPYPLCNEDRVRNYAIGLQEIGYDLTGMKNYFGERITPYLDWYKGAKVNIEIISATYGGLDITNKLRQHIRPNGLNVVVNNSLSGVDPCIGTKKTLVVQYKVDGVEHTQTVEEHQCLSIRKSESKRLGIFYSNNNDDKVNSYVLQKLSKAAEGKADILTCLWRPIADNPFPSIQAMTTNPNHLNIALQILQLLYRAQDSGEYDYVSFLEHDVMYPEGYFDYPEFEQGIAIYNTNLIGVCADGFQKYPHTHDSIPLHQMTLRFSDALEWFKGCVEKAIRHGQIMLEPEVPRKPWTSINPAAHVNHGHNFTSHCTLYSEETEPTNSYWGDYKELGLF